MHRFVCLQRLLELTSDQQTARSIIASSHAVVDKVLPYDINRYCLMPRAVTPICRPFSPPSISSFVAGSACPEPQPRKLPALTATGRRSLSLSFARLKPINIHVTNNINNTIVDTTSRLYTRITDEIEDLNATLKHLIFVQSPMPNVNFTADEAVGVARDRTLTLWRE
jgi:hypothetical protein